MSLLGLPASHSSVTSDGYMYADRSKGSFLRTSNFGMYFAVPSKSEGLGAKIMALFARILECLSCCFTGNSKDEDLEIVDFDDRVIETTPLSTKTE